MDRVAKEAADLEKRQAQVLSDLTNQVCVPYYLIFAGLTTSSHTFECCPTMLVLIQISIARSDLAEAVAKEQQVNGN